MRQNIRQVALQGGTRLVTEKIPNALSVSLGVWIETGARHEDRHESGISHFTEHLLFKGTKKRTAREIALTLESIGGYLDARLAVNANSNGGRIYHRNDAEVEDNEEPARFHVPNPLPEMFQDRLDEPTNNDSDDDRFAEDSSEPTTEDSGFFGRMTGWWGSE
jgi:hypothetical protein